MIQKNWKGGSCVQNLNEVQNEILSLLSQYVQTYLINQIKSEVLFNYYR